MKKQKAKKGGGKKDEKSDSVTESQKAGEEKVKVEPEPIPEPIPEVANGDEPNEARGSESKDGDETAPPPSQPSHGRQPSISVQSKMRSSSFRASGGPLSPAYGFSPDGDTAPDIHRKQAIRIEELEKENKRLGKEATDGEKRWKKAEGELEDLREADGDSAKGKDTASGASSQEIEKLVCEGRKMMLVVLTVVFRRPKMRPFNDRLHNCNRELRDMVPLHPYLRMHPEISRLSYNPRTRRSSLWRSKFLTFELNWIV